MPVICGFKKGRNIDPFNAGPFPEKFFLVIPFVLFPLKPGPGHLQNNLLTIANNRSVKKSAIGSGLQVQGPPAIIRGSFPLRSEDKNGMPARSSMVRILV